MQKAIQTVNQTLKDLSQDQLSKIERLFIGCSELGKLQPEDEQLQSLVKVAPFIKYLKLNRSELLYFLEQKGLFNLSQYQNLEQLYLTFRLPVNFSQDLNEFLEKNLSQLQNLKQLKKLYIDLSSQRLEHAIGEELSKLAPLFQQLETLRLELGENDIRDLGCEHITNTISKLKNLKELQLGLEQNNLSNYSFKGVINMISELDQLESLQIDFWDNQHDYEAYDGMSEILKGKKICSSLQEIRLSTQFYHNNVEDSQNPVEFFKAISLFTNLRKCYLQFGINEMNLEIAQIINGILHTNKKTLETFIGEFNLESQTVENPTSNCITQIFANIEDLESLQNLYYEFHPKQSIESALEFFHIISKCRNLQMIGISTSFNELLHTQFKDCINYFKNIIELNSLIFQYAETYYNLDMDWYRLFFEQTWKYNIFIDETLVQLTSQSIKNENKKKRFRKQINKIQDLIEDQFYDYSSGSEENNDEESEDSELYDSNEESEDSELDSSNEEIEEESSDQLSQQSSSGDSPRINQKGLNEKVIDDQTGLFEQQEKQMDKIYSRQANLNQRQLVPYLITQRYFNYKRIELLRQIIYKRQIQSVIQNIYPQQPHMLRNFWDLYY